MFFSTFFKQRPLEIPWPRAMPGMFQQVDEWWANSTDLLVCCLTGPTRLRRLNASEQHQGEVLTAGLINKAADASTPRRCSSAPDQRAQSVALRRRQRKLVDKLCGVHENFVDVFAVPSSHPAPSCFLADISTSALSALCTKSGSSASHDATPAALLGAGAQACQGRPSSLSSVSPIPSTSNQPGRSCSCALRDPAT